MGADTNPGTETESAAPVDDDDALLPFSLPSIAQEKVTAAFGGGLISSDGGVPLLAGADKRLGPTDTPVAIIPDHRDPTQIIHTMSDILRTRILACRATGEAASMSWRAGSAGSGWLDVP